MTPRPQRAVRRSHKKMDPEIKALYAILRAIQELPSYEARRRVIDYVKGRLSL